MKPLFKLAIHMNKQLNETIEDVNQRTIQFETKECNIQQFIDRISEGSKNHGEDFLTKMNDKSLYGVRAQMENFRVILNSGSVHKYDNWLTANLAVIERISNAREEEKKTARYFITTALAISAIFVPMIINSILNIWKSS